MTEDEAVERLNELAEDDSDYEAPHIIADDILLQFVPHRVAEAYGRVGKWYA